MFARNVCFSRSEWQDPRLMYPFPGAIGRFRIHGARILPPRPPFRVERPEITHSAKNLPALPGFSAAADRSLAERALRPAARAWSACRMRGSLPSRPHRANQPGSAAACITLAALSTPIVATRIAHRSRGGEWRAAATRARSPPLTAAARICRVLAPRPPPVLPVACARHPRPIPSQTSGTARATQCGHKNRIPEWGSY